MRLREKVEVSATLVQLKGAGARSALERARLGDGFDVFSCCAGLAAVVVTESSCAIAIHHCEKTKIARGRPKRMLRWGTKSVVSEFPQRSRLSGALRIV